MKVKGIAGVFIVCIVTLAAWGCCNIPAYYIKGSS